MSTEPNPVTVTEQNASKLPPSTSSGAVNTVEAKANTKQAASSESKKSAKPEKKQGYQ